MNTEIQTFNFNSTPVRTLTDEAGDPWFVAKDICDILGLSNPSVAIASLDEDEVTQINPKQYLGSGNRIKVARTA